MAPSHAAPTRPPFCSRATAVDGEELCWANVMDLLDPETGLRDMPVDLVPAENLIHAGRRCTKLKPTKCSRHGCHPP
ncbi:hypothetical protein AB0G02_28430 [Actinosynnema sp. NPDC023658]|uniref:hypothetical protein n=1 Tax=Actinosynnema sp. NPDC023658 TaxID=3155465 RepID=UPI0033DCBBA5